MKLLITSPLSVVFALVFSTALTAQDNAPQSDPSLILQANTHDLSEFVWKKRPIVVFADSEDDPAFIEQLELLRTRPEALIERDVVVLLDTNPSDMSQARKKLRPRGFMLAILNKEGRVQLRKPFPWDVREITRSIDKLPIRKREIQAAKQGQNTPR